MAEFIKIKKKSGARRTIKNARIVKASSLRRVVIN